MFKRSKPASDPNLFSVTDHFLSESSMQTYHDANSWHNQFYAHICSRIEESVFADLYDEHAGVPNAPITLLVSMMVLKEAFGWSDAQLFEHCRFHLLVRKALGLTNLDDPVPSASTYYLFRKRVYEYDQAHATELMSQAFSRLTGEQLATFEVDGEQLRMDSKLFGSNIAWYSRYEVIHESLLKFCAHMSEADWQALPADERRKLEALTGEEPNKVVYYETKDQLTDRMQQMGGGHLYAAELPT